MNYRCRLLVLVAFVTHAPVVWADTYRLTLDQALDLARARSPAVRGAAAQIAAANARVVGASVRDNPSLEFGGGPRHGSDGDSTDFEVALSQSFELGGKRRARIDSATAQLDATTATASDRRRGALREVAVAFLRALHVDERLRVARQVEALSVELAQVASSRYDSGDVGILDKNLAAIAVAKAQAEVRRLQAAVERTVGDLRIVLGLAGDAEIAVTGALLEPRRYELGALLARAGDRADLQAIAAALREADAETRLAKAQSWPDLGLGVGYAREERADIVTGGVTLTLPVFDRGKGPGAVARAQGDLFRIELEVGRNSIDGEVRAAYATYQGLLQAVDHFERDGLPQIESTDELTRLSYEAGAIPLGELLTARRELIEARVAYADLLLDAALAGIDVEAAAGLLQ